MRSSAINLKNKIIIDAEPKDDKIEILYYNGKKTQVSNTTENADKILDKVLKQEQFRSKMEKVRLDMPFNLPFYFIIASIALIPLGALLWGSIGAFSTIAFLIGSKVVAKKIVNKMYNKAHKMRRVDLAKFQRKLLKKDSFEEEKIKQKISALEPDLAKDKNGKVLDMISKLKETKKQLKTLSDDKRVSDGIILNFDIDKKIK